MVPSTDAFAEMLYRIDERTSTLCKDFEEFKDMVNGAFISRAEFEPVRKLVYGLVTLILTTVFGSILALVIKQ
jgi:ABC-type phosphate transport system permease subunit